MWVKSTILKYACGSASVSGIHFVTQASVKLELK